MKKTVMPLLVASKKLKILFVTPCPEFLSDHVLRETKRAIIIYHYFRTVVWSLEPVVTGVGNEIFIFFLKTAINEPGQNSKDSFLGKQSRRNCLDLKRRIPPARNSALSSLALT
ncbi:unnamed protein product, partial [Sphacelaria rigidula]